MNWVLKLRSILGPFWSRVFQGKEFIASIYNAIGLTFSLLENAYNNWKGVHRSIGGYGKPDNLPILIKVSEKNIHKAGVPLESITSGEAALGDTDADSKYILKTSQYCGNAGLLTRTATDTSPIVYGKDFDVQETRIILTGNPIDHGIPSTQVVSATADEEPSTEYRFFCWNRDAYLRRENVNDILGLPFYGDAADAAWAIHVQGATVYNVKWLFCSLTDCVIAKTAGRITQILTTEAGTEVSVDGVLYTDNQRRQCNFEKGTTVRKGDILFGNLHVYYSGDTPSYEDLPSLQVMTDVGLLSAENKEVSLLDTMYHDDQTGLNCLPLTGDATRVHAYVTRCRELAKDAGTPRIQVPDVVNPLLFILNVLRWRRALCIVIPDTVDSRIEQAIQFVSKNAPAGSIISIIRRADVSTQLSLSIASDVESALSVEAEASILDSVSADAESKELI